MEILTKASWGLLALLHLAPSLPVFRPAMIETLYGTPADGDLGVLLVHRGALFAAVLIACAYATFHTDARRLATLVAAISMIGFLVIYMRAGLPSGALRKIAVADLVGLVPLALVTWQAWR